MENARDASSALVKGLTKLRSDVVQLGTLAGRQLNACLSGMSDFQQVRVNQIIEKDTDLDNLHKQIAEQVLNVSALQVTQPHDLRLILSAIKVASDFERIGDYARNIAKRTSAVMGGAGDAKMPWDALIEIGTLVASMIDDVLDAYQQGDIEAAQAIRNSDIHVDKLNTGFMKSMIKMMEDDKVSALDGTHLIFMSKNLERIGDYTTSIAEQIHFIETGTQPDDERPKADGSSMLSSL